MRCFGHLHSFDFNILAFKDSLKKVVETKSNQTFSLVSAIKLWFGVRSRTRPLRGAHSSADDRDFVCWLVCDSVNV